MYPIEQKPSDQDIHDRIVDAILARRVQPGARLVEEDLAGLFGVSRTKVRNAIAKLAQDGIVTVRRHHGASVAAPTRAEARQVIAFRAMVEPPLVAALAADRKRTGLRELDRHVAAERAARAAGDDARLIRLTGAFHLKLATLHGNALLIRALREAEALMCLAIVSYGRPHAAACLPDEHERILAAIRAGDAAGASALMCDHLAHLQAEMELDEPAPAATSGLAAALGLPGRRGPTTRRSAA